MAHIEFVLGNEKSQPLFEVPGTQMIDLVCEAVLGSSKTAIYTVEDSLVQRFQLRRLSSREARRVGIA